MLNPHKQPSMTFSCQHIMYIKSNYKAVKLKEIYNIFGAFYNYRQMSIDRILIFDYTIWNKLCNDTNKNVAHIIVVEHLHWYSKRSSGGFNIVGMTSYFLIFIHILRSMCGWTMYYVSLLMLLYHSWLLQKNNM